MATGAVWPTRRNIAGDTTYPLCDFSLWAELLRAACQVKVARHTRAIGTGIGYSNVSG